MMNGNLRRSVERINEKNLRETRRTRLRGILGFAVVFAVLYALLMPAFTLEKPTYCGLEEHVHTDECYILVPASEAHNYAENGINTKTSTNTGSDGALDTVNFADPEKDITADLRTATASDFVDHEAQYLYAGPSDSGPTPELPAGPSGYESAAEEPESTVEWIPEAGEGAESVRTNTDTEKEESLPESGAALDTEEAADSPEAGPSGVPEIIPEAAAEEEIEYVRILICGKEEHKHSLSCYIPTDTAPEDPDIAGDRAEELLPLYGETKARDSYAYAAALAEFLKGDHEDTSYYQSEVEDDGTETEHGYTRYGAWADDPYAEEWSALFAAYTAAHAGLNIHTVDPDTSAEELYGRLYGDMDVPRTSGSADKDLTDPDTGVDSGSQPIGGLYEYFIPSSAENPTEDLFDRDPYTWMQNLREAGLFRDVENYIGGAAALADDESTDADETAEYTWFDTESEDAQESAYEWIDPEAVPHAIPVIPGDLVFLDLDEDFDADHVGIVTRVNLDKYRIIAMVGDLDAYVREQKYDIDDLQVLGYARLPETIEAYERSYAGSLEDEEPLSRSDLDAEDRRDGDADTYTSGSSDGFTDNPYLADADLLDPLTGGTYETLSYADGDYRVDVYYGDNALIPEGTDLYAEEILPGSSAYEDYLARAAEALNQSESKLTFARFFDISLIGEDGTELEPAAPVRVSITYDDAVLPEDGVRAAVHFDEAAGPEVLTVISANETITSASIDEFGENTDSYEINASGETSDLDAVSGTSRDVLSDILTPEISADPFAHISADKLANAPANVLADASVDAPANISSNGSNEPESTSAVVLGARRAAANTGLLETSASTPANAASNAASASVSTPTAGQTFSFLQSSFSVTGTIVYTVDFHYDIDGKTYEFSIPGGGMISLRDLVEILGIRLQNADAAETPAGNLDERIDEDNPANESSGAATDPEGQSDAHLAAAAFIADIADVRFSDESLVQVAQITKDITGLQLKVQLDIEPLYSAELTEAGIAENLGRTFTAPDWVLISLAPFDTEETLTVTMKNGDVFTIRVTDDNDPLGLNGRTFAIVTKKGGTVGHALQAGVHTAKDNRGYYMTSLDVELNNTTQYNVVDGVEYVRQDATAWTFEYNAEKQAYYISNNGQYLYIDPNITSKNGTAEHSLNLVDTKDMTDEGTLITITKDSDGNYTFGNKNGTLLWDYGNGYWLSHPTNDNETATERLSSVIHLCLPEDPNGSHKAKLTAAADLANGQSVIIYQKVWNNAEDKYEFYAIDGTGRLQQVWDSSDSLYWKEDLSIEWKLVELTNDQGNPSGYLQFFNEKTNTYLAPKSDGSGYAVVHAADRLTTDTLKTISVSLPGRDAGQYASRIATWDYDDNTTYGLDLSYNPINASDPYTLEVRELLQSAEFLFAVRDPLVQKQLTTVDTVDSAAKGIKITMYDFSGTEGRSSGRWYNESTGTWETANDRLQFMTDAIGNADWRSGYYWPGLMKRTLEDNGYPNNTVNNNSLGNIFSSTTGQEANHLFLQSVYDTTGYFYYSGFDNYARLPEDSSDFIVYEQIGTPQNQGTTNGTPSHPENFFYYRGNFMPFNELDTSNPVLNYYDGGDQKKELSADDPRKSEDLYTVKGTPNYFFGMILETKFAQGPNGLSDQGDPMVFEFTGDDDMWVYVDGVLLLDIGGIHDAFHGKINFQTGKIHVDGQRTGNEDTYIKEQFWQARKFPDGSPWTNREDTKQNEFFTNGGEENGKLKGTFLDLSTHDMKMFYMERGKGASNLQIQFNLPVITGDEFRVTKDMSSTATGGPIQSAYSNAAFYYQAYIRKNGNWELFTKNSIPSGKSAVYDDEARSPVVWKDEANGIFELKPGQTVIFPVEDSNIEYKIEEVEPESGSRMLENFNVSNSDEDPTDSKSTTGKTVQRRGQVFYDNKPVDEIVNELRIVKNLHGDLYKDPATTSKLVEDENGSPYFEFRIYLENTDGQLVPYSLGEYYQIDGATGRYVYYDKGERRLAEVIADGQYRYTYPNSGKAEETLPEPKITEHTSQNGSLGDVRPGDTIIVKGLMEGTDFVVDERTDRTHMTESNMGDWNNKYYYSRTDVTNAMQRDSEGQPTTETKPSNYEIAGTLFNQPPNAGTLAVNGKAARGTIVANQNAEVVVHNEIYNQFALPIEKKWSDDFDMTSLGDTEVSFTLKRMKLEERKGSFTLGATASGYPAGYDPEYIFTNTHTGETIRVRFSEMTDSISGDTHTKQFSLPIGSYTVSYGEAPEGYDVTHTPSGSSVTVTSDDSTEGTAGTGATADPATLSVTSTYTRQTGSIQITKTLAGFHGNNSFENFTATYTVTDTAGREVQDASGNTVGAATLSYSNFTGSDSEKTATITFDNLPAGQYLVRETVASSSYDNTKYTVIHTSEPESGIVTVAKGDPAQVAFTSTYTEVKSNPVPVTVQLSNIWNSEIKNLYSNTASFHPGDQIIVTFVHQNNNIGLRYRIGNGDWVTVPVTGNGGSVTDEIHLTVPEGGLTIEFQDDWTQLKSDNINVIKEQPVTMSTMSAVSARSMAPLKMQMAAPRRAQAESPQLTVNNTAPMPDPTDPNYRYNPDAWSLVVTMKGDGKLYNASDEVVGTVQKNASGTTWDVNLEGAKFDDLTAQDEEGNRYYYYIDSITEKNYPTGTRASIDLETDGTKYLYSRMDQDDATGRVLAATNELIRAYGDVSLQKVDENGQVLPGAEFSLYRSYKNGELSNPLQKNGTLVTAISAEETGSISFTHVPAGTWYLKEIKAPDGYRISPVVYQVEITIKSGQEAIEDPEQIETETRVTVLGSDETVSQIVNTPVTYGEVSFHKTDAAGTPVPGAVFTLYEDAACTNVLKVNDMDVTAQSDSIGTVKFTAERAVDGKTVTGIETGDYYTKETIAPSGYTLNPQVYFVHIGEGTAGDTSFIAPVDSNPGESGSAESDPASMSAILAEYYRSKLVTAVINEPVKIIVKKIDEADKPLTGAKFKLTKTADAEGNPVSESDPGAVLTRPGAEETDLAVYTFDRLTDGSYKLEETTAPTGYKVIANPAATFRIENGVIQSVSTAANVTFDADGLTFTVKNEPDTDSGKITIRKQWLDFFGNAMEPEGIDEISLTLVQWKLGEPVNYNVSIDYRYTGTGGGNNHNNNDGVITTSFATRNGSGSGDVTITWGYNQYTNQKEIVITDQYGTHYESFIVENGSAANGGNGRAVIPNLTRDLSLTVLLKGYGWDSYDSSKIGQPEFSGSNEVNDEYIVTGGTKTITLRSDGTWRQEFNLSGDGLLSESGTNLPRTYNKKICLYTIEERAVPSGYTLTQISTDKIQSGVLTAYNKKTTVDLTIVKLDQHNEAQRLNGAAFELKQLDDAQAGVAIKTGGRSDSGSTSGNSTEAGKLTFKDLGIGYYQIKETGTPDGYVISGNDTFYIKVTSDGISMLQRDDEKTPGQWEVISAEGNVSFAAEQALASITNEPGVALPSAGGPGTDICKLLGSVMLLGAGVLLWRKRKPIL